MTYELYDYAESEEPILISYEEEGFIKELKEKMSIELATWITSNLDFVEDGGMKKLKEDLDYYTETLQSNNIETISKWLKDYWSEYTIKVEY